ncbi:MAG: hypothetical protein V2J20_00300 [Wenzhouxiangella sp.]|jgi:hypothetical protein|nr:hypothetical protein [Wenzhouxiangella sp.]
MINLIGLILGVMMVVSCHSLGPESISKSHGLYGQAIATSQNQQFLENLVRLRYRETPFFLEVGSVTASLSFQSSLGVDSGFSTGSGPDIVQPSAGAAYSNSPTISYTPLQGEDFLRKVLVAVPIESLIVLMQSGWNAERIFGMCVERINGLENAPSASGPTPDRPPGNFGGFERLLDLLEGIRGKNLVSYSIEPESNKLLVQFNSSSDSTGSVAEIKSLLGLSAERNVFTLTSNERERGSDTIAIRTRSIMSILFYLSQTVEAPKAHEDAGYVSTTRNQDGSRFDWRTTPAGKLFGVQQSRRRPASAYLAVPYRGYWFSIPNNDLSAKSSFMLMTQLFNLNAGAVQGVKPTLTIPVGR